MESKNQEKQTILSPHDVMEMQMVEGLPKTDRSFVNEHQEMPDLSVGWYASPQVDPDD